LIEALVGCFVPPRVCLYVTYLYDIWCLFSTNLLLPGTALREELADRLDDMVLFHYTRCPFWNTTACWFWL